MTFIIKCKCGAVIPPDRLIGVRLDKIPKVCDDCAGVSDASKGRNGTETDTPHSTTAAGALPTDTATLNAGEATDQDARSELEPTLQVIVTRDGDGWTAQAVEADYAACGKSPKDARTRFVAGLEATARKNLEKHGNVSRLLMPATPETWAPLMAQGCRGNAKPRIRRERINLREVGLQWRTIAYIVCASTGFMARRTPES